MNLDNFDNLFDKNTFEVDEIKQLISKYFTRKYVSKEEKNVFFERLIGAYPELKHRDILLSSDSRFGLKT